MARIRSIKPEFWAEPLPEMDISRAWGMQLAGWIGSRDYYGNGPWTDPGDREWWVYFIQGDDGGPIKIGRTTNIRARLSELKVGYPFGALRFVGLMRAKRIAEKQLHERFSHLRLCGEWFAPGADLLEFVTSLPKGGW